jgi:hypothetical protein
MVHDPPSSEPLSPREVLAEERAAGAGGDGTTNDGAVGEVLTADHVRGVSAGGAHEVIVHAEWGETMAPPDGIHGVEERPLGARDAPGLRRRGGKQDGENDDKSG